MTKMLGVCPVVAANGTRMACKRELEELKELAKLKQSALDVQEGGSHYKNLKIQPVEFIHSNNLSFIQGNIIKYVVRYKDKKGLEDLKKAQHYLNILIELEYEK